MAQVKKSAQVAPARKAAKLKAESKARRDRPASRQPHRPESDAPVATPISASPRQARGPPRKFHLDKRAAAIAAEPGDDDELLTTSQMATWLGVSVQWLDIGRHAGYRAAVSETRSAPRSIPPWRGAEVASGAN